MNAHSQGETTSVPWIPSAIAPISPITANAQPPSGIAFGRRPFSSSRACAARPIARKKASRVSTSHRTSTTGAMQAPNTT
jgi:hypothetical protein